MEIHKLSVPSLVKYGTMGEVFLDCDFDHSEEEEKQLEVKWYHNDEHSPFFQVRISNESLTYVFGGSHHTPHTVYSLTKRVSPEMLQTFDATNL